MSRNIQCRFDGCKLTFKDETALIEHMVDDPDHDYCEKCDELCKDWDDYMRHLVQSDKHTACPECGKEFKSLSGLERHVKLDHRTKQSLLCLGCQSKYANAGELIGHLEKGMCRNESRPQEAISKLKFQDHINQKTIIEHMLNEDSTSIGNPARVAPAGPDSLTSTTSASTAKTGVPLGSIDISVEHGSDGTSNVQPTAEQWPSLSRKTNATSSSSSEVDRVTQSVSSLNVGSAWSKQQTTSSSVSGDMSPLRGRAQAVNHGPVAPAWTNGPSSAVMQNAPNNVDQSQIFAAGLRDRDNEYSRRYNTASTSAASRPDITSINGGSDAGPSAWNTRFWNPRSSAWDPNKFWNSTFKVYQCPHRDCSYNDASVSAFQSHCYDSHKPVVYRCPTCLREYKTLQALVQHCESSTTRCGIRKTRDYAKFMDHVTGGFVDASQRNGRGEVMYQMTRPKEFVDRASEPGFW